jgi:Tfp pilus assembly protein PilW
MNSNSSPLLRSRVDRRQAFTLLETVISTGIATVVLGAVAILGYFSANSFAAMGNYADLDAASRHALDTMSREIRSTRHLTSFSTTSLTFQDYDTNSLTYVYDSTARTLTRQKGGTNTVLLQQCDYLNFDISQRNPSSNFTFYAASGASTAKLIDLSWRCSRTILGAKINTESVQTAKIVIRN